MHVGSMMIKSPGAAASIALWTLAEAFTWVGALPPRVTVTVSTDCLPLPAVMTSSPQRAADPPNCACCWTVHAGSCGLPGRPPGTVTVMLVSLQVAMTAAIPPTVTLDCVLQVALPAVGVLQRAPKP